LLIACAQHLVKEKYTSKEKIAIRGASAGGLLMGAVTNLAPDLFKVVIAEVPFVDGVNSMEDPNLPLTAGEFEEWGNPIENKEHYEYIKKYSPYDNIQPKAYPNILSTGGLNDTRVQYWEPLKWAAKLRETKTDSNTVLIKIELGRGHSGSSGRYDALKDETFIYSFILDKLGISG
jgi:oligopeptidase B